MKKHQILMMVDEVQTGIGPTGKSDKIAVLKLMLLIEIRQVLGT